MRKTVLTTALLLATATAHAQIEVSTLADLDNVRNNLSADYILVNDIDASATADPDYNGGEGWMPIGRVGQIGFAFTGTFDGQGFSITGLTFDRPDGVPQSGYLAGLFCDLDGAAAISDLHLVNVDLQGNSMVGGIAGRIRSQSTATVTNCSVSGRVRAEDRAGGLIGLQASGVIQNCWTEGQIETFAFNRHAGGLVGFGTGGTIRNSYSTCDVSGADWVGGLVGAVVTGATVEESFATGDVTGTGSLIGGLVGAQSGIIVRSYATGNVVAGPGSFGLVGGLVGRQDGSAVLEDSFARGTVTGPTAIGGVLGFQRGSGDMSRCYATGSPTGDTNAVGGVLGQQQEQGTVAASYWDTNSSGIATSAGGAGVIGLSTAQMTTPFAGGAYTGWDFTAVWLEEADVNNGYPIHRWQTTRNTLQYTAGPNGSLAGDLQQTRIPGAHGAPITAVPDQGFAFLRWSDGSGANPRRDLKVMNDINVTAIFFNPEETTSLWVIH